MAGAEAALIGGFLQTRYNAFERSGMEGKGRFTTSRLTIVEAPTGRLPDRFHFFFPSSRGLEMLFP